MTHEPLERRSWYRWLSGHFSPWGAPTATIRLHLCYVDRLGPFAHRIVDRLKARYADLHVTTSTDAPALTAGERVDLLFVLIDGDWADCLQLTRPGILRPQVQQALAIGGLPVVPLLVGQTEMPSEQQLGDLAPLADRNAVMVDPGRSFEDDITLLIDGINLHFRNVPIRWATASSKSGNLAKIARLADRVLPLTVPPEYCRGYPGLWTAVYVFLGLFIGAGLAMAIKEGDGFIGSVFVFLGLMTGRTALFTLREAYAAPYFQGKPEIFLSYRRADTVGMAGRIYDRLRDRFGVQTVFMDVGGCIPIGADFRDHLHQQISSSRVVILLIGDDWIGARRREAPRIHNVRDFVRIEVEFALTSGKPIFVVLMDRETLPARHELPASLQPICDLPTTVVRTGPAFEDEVNQFMAHLGATLTARRPTLFRRWLDPFEKDLGLPWWRRALNYGFASVLSIGFVVVIYSIEWVDNSWGQHIGAGAVATIFALPGVLAIGKVLGAFRDRRWARETDRRKG